MARRQSIFPEITPGGLPRRGALVGELQMEAGPSCFLPGRSPARHLPDPRKAPRWRRIRRQTFLRDSGLCRRCGHPAHDVDHIIEIGDGGDPYSLANLQSLCRDCHQVKTDEARRDRIRRLVATFGPITFCPRCSGTGRCPFCTDWPHSCSMCLGNRIVPVLPNEEQILPQALLAGLGEGPLAGAVRVREDAT